jgi:hypothetical protein
MHGNGWMSMGCPTSTLKQLNQITNRFKLFLLLKNRKCMCTSKHDIKHEFVILIQHDRSVTYTPLTWSLEKLSTATAVSSAVRLLSVKPSLAFGVGRGVGRDVPGKLGTSPSCVWSSVPVITLLYSAPCGNDKDQNRQFDISFLSYFLR